MSNNTTAHVFTVLLLASCEVSRQLPGDDSLSTSSDEGTGDTISDSGTDTDAAMPDLPQPDFWIEFVDVRCITGIDGPVCFARPDGAADSWVPVVDSCRLDLYKDHEVEAWGPSTCANGLAPELDGWEEVRCFDELSSQGTLCFGIASGWATAMIPICSIDIAGASEPWPATICANPIGPIGAVPWDASWCLDSSVSQCFAEQGGGLMTMVPTCWLDEREPWPGAAPGC